jgi:hypothetical protein
MHDTPKLNKERPDDYEERTWREKCTTDEHGNVCIPGIAPKMLLDAMAKRRGDKTKGKGTFTKHFVGGVQPLDLYSTIGVRKDDIQCIKLWCHSTGQRGSGSRVLRWFPQAAVWKATINLGIVDDAILPHLLEEYMQEGGQVIGLGRWRPEQGGLNGRFKVKSIKWTNGG